jgi:heat shock protein HtpX
MWDERREDWRDAAAAVLYGSYSVPPALVLAGLSRLVSRHRELAADRGSALLTGSPSALAAALLTLSGELARMPRSDLRAVAPLDPLRLLPAKPEPKHLGRLWATHPPLAVRLAELEGLEVALQSAG